MIPKFNKTTLKNSLDIYHIPVNLGSNVISVNVFYKVGSRNEIMGKSGIAHMLEHLNFKSTKNRDAGEFDNIVKGFGGVNNASTGFDYTHYFIKCSKQNLEKSLELYADIMANLNLKDEEFLPERNVVLEERRWSTDNNPFGYLFFRLYNNAFLYHSYHWTPIGFKDDIKNWTIDDIRDFHSKFYQPKNAFIIIAGDIDKKSAFEYSKKYFEEIKNRQDIPILHTYEPKQDGYKEVFIQKDSEVEILAMAYKIPPFLHEDSTALEAICGYLGEGKSSILYKSLVDEKGLASSIEIYNLSSIDENLFIIFGICNQDIKALDLKAEILAILEDEKNKELSDDDFEKIKNKVKSDLVYSFDSASKTASIFGSYIAKDGLNELIKVEEKINALSKESIKEVFNRYFLTKNLTSAILTKEAK